MNHSFTQVSLLLSFFFLFKLKLTVDPQFKISLLTVRLLEILAYVSLLKMQFHMSFT